MQGRTVLDLDAARKHWADLAARLAIAGYSATRSDPLDGPASFYVGRWGHARSFSDLAEVERFAVQVGA